MKYEGGIGRLLENYSDLFNFQQVHDDLPNDTTKVIEVVEQFINNNVKE